MIALTRRFTVATLAMLTTVGAVAGQDARPQGDVMTTAKTHLPLEDTPTLTVRGQAELQKPAEVIRLTVGVVTEGSSAGTALDENSRQMQAVVESLEKLGLTEDELQTGRFQIRPTYARRPRQPSEDWRPEIIGYRVDNSLNVRTKRLDLAGKIIETANAAGANSVEVSGFELSDNRAPRAEVIADATRNAIADAKVLAEAASLELVRIISIGLDSAPMPSAESSPVMARAMVADAATPPIVPGDITLRASVTIVYEIRGR